MRNYNIVASPDESTVVAKNTVAYKVQQQYEYYRNTLLNFKEKVD